MIIPQGACPKVISTVREFGRDPIRRSKGGSKDPLVEVVTTGKRTSGSRSNQYQKIDREASKANVSSNEIKERRIYL